MALSLRLRGYEMYIKGSAIYIVSIIQSKRRLSCSICLFYLVEVARKYFDEVIFYQGFR